MHCTAFYNEDEIMSLNFYCHLYFENVILWKICKQLLLNCLKQIWKWQFIWNGSLGG